MYARTLADMRVNDDETAEALRTARRRAGRLWLLSPVWYLLCEAIAARAFPGYSYSRFYISDLGVAEHGEIDGRELASGKPQVMNAGFLGAGALFLAGLLPLLPHLRGKARRTFVSAGLTHALGIATVGIVPGSPTNINNGLIRVHGAGAVAAIGGGNLAAIASGSVLGDLDDMAALKRSGPALGTLGFFGAVMLSLHRLFPDGVWERVAVYAVFAWQLLTGALLLRDRKPHA